MSPLLLFPDFSLIALGYLLRRWWLPASAWVTIEKLVYFVLFPALLFQSVVKSDLVLAEAIAFAASSPSLILLTFVLAWVFKAKAKLHRIDYAGGAQTAYRFNTYIALALISRLAGAEGVASMAILVALGVPLCNVLAVGTMSKGKSSQILIEILKNPLILGTVAGLAFKLSNIPVWEPASLTLDRLSQAAVTLGLLAVGSGLVFSGLKGHAKISIWWLSLKLLVGPVIAILYSKYFELSTVQSQALLVFAGAPSASSAYILASRMGANATMVACLISLSTVLAAASIPIIFWVAKYLG